MAVSSSSGGFFTVSGFGQSFLVPDFSEFVSPDLEALFRPDPSLAAEGSLRRVLDVALDANALVDKFEVIVTARPAIATFAAEVGQPRIGGTGLDLIIDFGAPRTVSMIQVGGGFTLTSVNSWNGMAFATPVALTSSLSGHTGILQETRSERLQLMLGGTGDKAALISQTLLVLPDAPADLELRINDGPPVWRQTGTVRLAPGTDLTSDGFNQNGQRVVDLTAAVAALTGDPTNRASLPFRLELTSRTAGRLDLAAPLERRLLRHVWRAKADNDAAPPVVFAAEGARALALTAEGMPETAALSEVRATLKGTPPPERVLPPVGPEPSDLAEFVLDANRAMLVRLPIDARLGSLTAVRLPLAAGPGGAQVTLALWSSTDAGEPDSPIPAGVSKAVPLDEGDEAWVTFAFDPPQARVAPPAPAIAPPLWAAILVSRGQVVWRPTLAASLDEEGGSLRTGPQAGPWYPLPALFDRAPGNAFGQLRGRVRVAGVPAKATPVAPILVDAGLAAAEAALVDAGVRVAAAAAPSGRTLTVTALAAMTVTLSEIDLVTLG